MRTPDQADRIKAQISELHGLLSEIRSSRKQLERNFFEIGLVLGKIRDRELYQAKGFASFEAFVDRELDLGRTLCLTLERIPRLFLPAAAKELGLAALARAITALEEPAEPAAAPKPLRPPTRPRR